ncbi:MAG: tyrosine--tRNA ligase, partial [Magnetospirillum sp.]
GSEINEAKKILANEVTRLAHGDAAAAEAAETARQTFEEGASADNLPTIEVPVAELTAGIPAFALFVRAGLAASNGDAKRLVKGGGGKLNDATIDTETRPVTVADLKDGVMKLTAGKKRHILVKAV